MIIYHVRLKYILYHFRKVNPETVHLYVYNVIKSLGLSSSFARNSPALFKNLGNFLHRSSGTFTHAYQTEFPKI